MSQFQIIIGCQFVNKGISQEVINSVLRGGGRGVGNGKATRGLGRRSRSGSCLQRGERRDPLANSCGFRQGASPRRADTSGDQRHSETFQACPLFHNEMSLSRTRRLGSTAESNLKESSPSEPARSVPKGERRWCLSSLQPTFQVFPHLSLGGGGEWERLKLRSPSLKPRRAWVGAHPAPSRDVRWLREALGPLQGLGEAKKKWWRWRGYKPAHLAFSASQPGLLGELLSAGRPSAVQLSRRRDVFSPAMGIINNPEPASSHQQGWKREMSMSMSMQTPCPCPVGTQHHPAPSGSSSSRAAPKIVPTAQLDTPGLSKHSFACLEAQS